VGWLLFPAMFLSVFRTRLPNWIEGLARDFRNAYIAARENWSVPVELVEENLRAKQQEQSRSTPMLLQTKQPFRRENKRSARRLQRCCVVHPFTPCLRSRYCCEPRRTVLRILLRIPAVLPLAGR
jgi:hypothetical protein